MLKSLLFVTDSYFALTGFAKVGRYIVNYLAKHGNFEIHYLCWFDPKVKKIIEPNPKIKYYTTKDNTKYLLEVDKYGAVTFPELYNELQTDIVFTVGDIWMIIPYIESIYRNRYKLVSYIPLDAEPMPILMNARFGKFNWIELIGNIDIPVAYTKWSMNVMNKRFLEAGLKEKVKHFIHHGVDTNIFKPLDIDKAKLREKLFGKEYKDKTVIGVFSRNQKRKSFFTQMDALRYILDHYPEDGKNLYLYFHASPHDPMGWDMHQIAKDIGVHDRIIWTDKIDTGFGVGCTDEEVNEYFNACTITVSNHTSEGFGLCLAESMAAGVPVLATDYSANTSWGIIDGKKAYIPLNPVIKIIIPEQGTRRAYVDPKHEAEMILQVLTDRGMYNEYRNRGLALAHKLTWDNVCQEWLELLDSIDTNKKIEEIDSFFISI